MFVGVANRTYGLSYFLRYSGNSVLKGCLSTDIPVIAKNIEDRLELLFWGWAITKSSSPRQGEVCLTLGGGESFERLLMNKTTPVYLHCPDVP